jgi:RNA polymerase sigma factor (sigma-70 family)
MRVDTSAMPGTQPVEGTSADAPARSGLTGETTRINPASPSRLARACDESVWQTLFQQYRAALRCTAERSLPRSVRGSTDGEDVVQDVFLRTCIRLQHLEFAHAGAFYAYLRRAVIHKVLDEVRRCARVPASVPMPCEIASDAESPLEKTIDHEQGTLYRAALLQLAPRDRSVLELRLEYGFSYKDIAVRLGIASSAAARMVSIRALRRLKSIIDARSAVRGDVCSRSVAAEPCAYSTADHQTRSRATRRVDTRRAD